MNDQTKTLFEWASAAIYRVCRDTIAKNQEVAPVIMTIDADGEQQITAFGTILVGDIQQDDDGKECVAQFMKAECMEHDVVAYVSEAWVVTKPDDGLPLDCAPSAHPDRQEVVMVLLNSRDFQTAVTHRIDRENKALIQGSLGDFHLSSGKFARELATRH